MTNPQVKSTETWESPRLLYPFALNSANSVFLANLKKKNKKKKSLRESPERSSLQHLHDEVLNMLQDPDALIIFFLMHSKLITPSCLLPLHTRNACTVLPITHTGTICLYACEPHQLCAS